MNISVKIHGKDIYLCRPDTTWEREGRDIYLPEDIGSIKFTPVVFARISKAGKFISERFADRYFDALNYGILLYPGKILQSQGPESLAFSSILDHSSILPFPLYLPQVFSTEGNEFIFNKDGRQLFKTSTSEEVLNTVRRAITQASRYVSQRIGDIVAVELSIPRNLLQEDEKRAVISAVFCENELFQLSIIK